jgi:hypothetical protein
MFSSRISAEITTDAQIINYVNAIPGAGKTWTFDHKIAVPHVINKHNSLLVYAAPTDKLLAEREQALIDLGVAPNRIVRISSKNTKHNVVEDFRTAVVGREGTKGEPNGNIILCTHECIARIPQDMRGRNRIVLVYDEARACLQDNYALHLPDKVYEYLTELKERDIEGSRKKGKLIVPREIYHGSANDQQEGIYIWKWANYKVALPRKEQIVELLPPTNKRTERTRNILEFLANIRSSSLDVYVSVERKQAKNEYVVSNVFSPSRMFRGYSKVLILSAFFESSQMYQFLAKGDQLDEHRTVLKDLTKKYIDRKRMVALLKRMQKVRLTYVYDLGDRTLTKTEMQSALVLRSILSKDQIKKINALWHSLYEKRPEHYRTIYDVYAQEGGRARFVSDVTREKPLKLMSAIAEKYTILGGVIPHMVETAIYLQQAFMKKAKLPLESLPVGINPRYKSYQEDATIWDAENLDQFNIRDKQFKKPAGGQIITKLPIAAHGLNAYKGLHSCAFLASMKYSMREHAFLRRTISDYNPTVDRTIDYALQLLWRCNVRMPSEDPVLLIVTDRKLAETLQKRFDKIAREWLGNHYAKTLDKVMAEYEIKPVLPILAPNKLLPDYKLPCILKYDFDTEKSQKKRNENRKNSVKGMEAMELKKIYRKTPEGSRYNSLTTLIAYNKKINRDTAKLEKERSGLQTFAQWKQSEEGIKIYKSMTFNPVEACREALQNLDATKFNDRNEALKILSVVKRTSLILKADAKAWYPGDKFELNWKTAEQYGTRYNLGWLFKQRQLYSK